MRRKKTLLSLFLLIMALTTIRRRFLLLSCIVSDLVLSTLLFHSTLFTIISNPLSSKVQMLFPKATTMMRT
nr:MAG TPA: hypothetical protein [Caudoviricetes sp.]